MKKENYRKIAVNVVMLSILILLMGVVNTSSHGFYCDELDLDIAKIDFQETISLEKNDYEMQFSPINSRFVGFEIFLVNQPDSSSNEGMRLTIIDEQGNQVDSVFIDLSKTVIGSWYKIRIHKPLKKGEKYTLRFSAVDNRDAPYLQTIDSEYLGAETITGNVLIGYAYAEQTFTFQNKILIDMFLISIWLFVVGRMINNKKIYKFSFFSSIIIFSTALLAWNYMYNSMDNQNTLFDEFQSDSEAVVTGVISAEHNGVWFEDNEGYGLGGYTSTLINYTDDNWFNNYSRTECAIIVNSNDYSRMYALEGNHILFENGEIYQITSISDDGFSLIMWLNAGRTLNSYKHGDVSKAIYCDYNKAPIAPIQSERLEAYQSLYGLQGKIFRYLAKYMSYDNIVENFHLICSVATACVFVIIVILISKKYNKILAGIFLFTFWLSPWVVNFARNLFWVEFTWFLPMAIGLFCALKISDQNCRIASYIMTFVAILIKCLCGYEYTSTIMMGLISFLLVDWIKAIYSRNKERSYLLFKTIFIIGVIAIAGFMAAICIHARLRGEGNVIEGIKRIFEEDVLRRTYGADFNEFSYTFWDSFNASTWDTYRKYFHFDTEIVTGITGNLFPLLCIIPLCIFGYEIRKRQVNIELVVMYIIFFISSVSWMCLAKGHSFIHTHMNYVLWYFGFVQICFYIIINKIISIVGNSRHSKME